MVLGDFFGLNIGLGGYIVVGLGWVCHTYEFLGWGVGLCVTGGL